MTAFVLRLTDAGLAAVEGLSGSDTATIAEVALSDTPFTADASLTTLPGEFKRIAAVAGGEVAANITHMSAYDTTSDVWSATGFGLFLDDGTLFACYSSDADPIMTKAAAAFALLSFDIAFNADISALISFGDPIFDEPPATETVRGIVKLATQARVDAETDGEDDATTVVTPKTLRHRLAALISTITAALASLESSVATALATKVPMTRTITGTGLASGGGDLTADRTIDVVAASGTTLLAGSADNGKALTLTSFTGMGGSRGGASGWEWVPTSSGMRLRQWGTFTGSGSSPQTVTFPRLFPNACDLVEVCSGPAAPIAPTGAFAVTGSQTTSGFDVRFSAVDLFDHTFEAWGY